MRFGKVSTLVIVWAATLIVACQAQDVTLKEGGTTYGRVSNRREQLSVTLAQL